MYARNFRPALAFAALAFASACTPFNPAFMPASTPLPGLLDDARTLVQPDNDARLDAVLALVERAGFTPRLFEFPNDGRAAADTRAVGRNVVFSVGPDNGEPVVIAGAHFDAAYLRDGTFVDGMADNAASVIALLRVAEAVRAASPARRVDFVLFDMEEIGLVGSRHYAESLAPGSVRAMVNLDVNAYGDTVFYGQAAHGHDPVYAAVATACADQRQECIEFGQYPFSDHLSFQRAGIPNVSLSVLPRAEVYQLWLLMNAGPDHGLAEGFTPGVFRTIHSPGDTIERVEPAAVTIAYNLAAAVLLALAQ